MLPGGRISAGIAQIKKNAATFAREEQQYGVPPAVIAGFWGLESDFGANMGKDQSIRSIATLAYDCRRSDMFRGQLFDSLRLIDRGDLTAPEMIGSWAGELGQTQMMPTEYIKYAVDYDGDGKRNLLRSAADVIGSTGNYLVSLGWKRGEPWLQEIRVPQNLPWKETGLDDQASARAMGPVGRDLSGRPRVAERQYADIRAAADGPLRAGVPGLRQFPGLPEMEQLGRLFDHGSLLRDAARRRAGHGERRRHGRADQHGADARAAAVVDPTRLRCRRR